jgi:hypothetical protein
MVQPIDYTIKTVDPTELFTKTLGMYQGIEQNQQALEANKLNLEAARQKIEAEKAGQERLRQIGELVMKAASPDATIDDMRAVMMTAASPEQLKAYESKLSAMTTEQKKAEFTPALQVKYALNSGKPDLAKKFLMDRATALENSGDAAGAQRARAMAETIDDDGGVTVSADIASKLAFDSEIGAPALKAMQEELLFKGKFAEGEAKAKSAGFQVTVDAAKAKYAEKNEKANYDKLLTDIGVNRAQISESQARTAESRASANRADAEAQSFVAGVIPAAKRPEAETALRKEYNLQTAPFREVQSSYRRVNSAESTGAGDIALVYGYMKMLDPGSVVREGEFATAEKTAGIPSAVVNAYNKALSGKRLTEDQRKIFKRQAGGLYNAALEGEKTVRGGIERIAKKGGLDTGQIFYESAPQRVATEAPVEKKQQFRQLAPASSKPGWGKASVVPGA